MRHSGTAAGLCLRLLPSGAASWQFIYRLRGVGRSGTQRTVTLGSWPRIDVRQAAEEARRLAGEVAARRDPRADINETKRREHAVVAAALDAYEKWTEVRRLRKVETMMRSFRRGFGHLLRRDLRDLDRVVLIDAIERIERSGRAGAARDFRKHLRTFINRQLSLGVISIDPLAGYRMPAATKNDVLEAEEHGKSLNEDEILAIWRAALAIGGPFGGLVQMGLLTGLRRGELAAMRWDWIDRDQLKITVPGKVMKNGREHAVPITNMIAKLLDETPDRGGGLVLPSEKRLGGATPMSGWSKMLTRLREASGVAGVGLHDLRRTYRSALADLSVREELAEATAYMFYLDMRDFHIVGASPELLVRFEDDEVTIRPIAGTRPRGVDRQSDEHFAKELKNDPKEQAEHVMLVDLARNDVGRVSTPGSINVTEFMEIERYSHVMHLVSNVTGHLREDVTPYDALRAGFPAGTVSGAPKIRAMEIISELEGEQRGVYAGAVGYFSHSGNQETAIALRTMVIKNGCAYIQAGCGVVADSDPTAEYQESLNKARALLRALDEAENIANERRGKADRRRVG